MQIKEKNFLTQKPSTGRSAQFRGRTDATINNDMTLRSLFNIMLKIVGIYLIKDILGSFSQIFSVLLYYPDYESPKESGYNLLITIAPFLAYGLFSFVLIFKTNWIISVLRLDRNFGNEKINLNFHRSTILGIVIIVVGGLQIIESLPEFFRLAWFYFQERKIYHTMAKPDVSFMLLAAIKVAIGFYLIIFNRSLVNFIEVRRKNRVPWHWPLKFPSGKAK